MRSVLVAALPLLACASIAQAQDRTPDQVLADNRAATGRVPAGQVRLFYAYAGQGLTGTARTSYDARTGAFVDSTEAGPTRGADGFDGRAAWARNLTGAVTLQDGGDKRRLAVNAAYRRAQAWWRPDRGGAAVASLGRKPFDGAACDGLAVTPAGGERFEAWFDAGTHLLSRTVEPQGPLTVTTRYTDYRPVGRTRVAAKVVIDPDEGSGGVQTQTLTQGEVTTARPLTAYAAPRWAADDAVIRNGAGRTTVPFQLIGNHVLAEVRINGAGPFLMMFSTGDDDTLVTSTVKALGVRVEGHAVGVGAGENTVDTGFARHVTFQVGDLVLRDQTVGVSPPFPTAILGVEDQGVLGFDLFRRFVVVVDYGAETLTFIDPARFDPTQAGVGMPLRFYDNFPMAAGSFEGVPGAFLIDTGSGPEMTITKPFADAYHLRESHPKGVVAVDGWGAGGRVIDYVTRARNLTLGPVEVRNLVAGFATQTKGGFADPYLQGVVGTQLLKRYVVTFDYAHRRIYLKALPGPVADTGVADRSGAWINKSAGGFEVVDVTPGGPAAQAGVKVGDQITEVDGRAASTLSLADLRARLRDAGVAQVVFTLEGAGRPRRAELRLRDLI